MHYYQFNIGDYSSHTGHLSPLEDIAYRRMLDYCYLHESPLPLEIEEIARKIRMQEHCDCIASVLHEFFNVTESGFLHARVVAEIKSFKSLSAKRKKAANRRWASNGGASKGDASALQVQSTSNANQEPRTINHKPLTNVIGRFKPPSRVDVTDYMIDRGVDVESAMNEAEKLIDFYTSKNWMIGKNKAKDWKAIVRNWLRRRDDEKDKQYTTGGPSRSDRAVQDALRGINDPNTI